MLSAIFGSKKETKPAENENPELAMRDALDDHGDFATTADGTMEFNDYCVMRSIITRQTNRSYLAEKNQAEEKLYQLFCDKKDAEFAQGLQKSTKIHTEIAQLLTKKSL
jgi:hypothetical protein